MNVDKKKWVCLVFYLCFLFQTLNGAVTSTTLSCAAPLNRSDRKTLFNDNWKFYLGELSGAHVKNYDDASWRNLTLPHDFSVEQDFTHDVRGEVGHLPGGIGWYRKNFVLPADYANKKIWIDFDGVYMDSHIYVNGEYVGNYPYGYMPFSYDLSDYLICDGKTENVIAVQATCITTPDTNSSRWYPGAGIYRDVFLRVTDRIYIPQYGMVITTPNIADEYKDGTVGMNIRTTVANESGAAVSVSVRHSILNYNGDSVFTAASDTNMVSIAAGGRQEISGRLSVKNPVLWSTDNPHLYRVKTEVLVDGNVVDTIETRYGFRWFHFDKDTGFTLNGNYMKLYGLCMHHDQGALGAVANETAIGRQMKILKEMGGNSIRVTHNPAAECLLKQCDEQGLLVIEEAFDTWYDGKRAYDYGRFFEKACTHPDAEKGITWAQFDLQQMVRRGINNPSTIMWSVGNEVGASDTEKGYNTIKKLIKWVKDIDPTRPVTLGDDKFRYNSPYDSNIKDRWFTKSCSELDVVGINYGVDNYDKYRELFPDWIIYGSETSSAVKSRGYYSDPQKTERAQDVVEYQLSSYDNCPIGHGDTATKTWILDRDRQWIAGQFIWTGFDYIGEPSPFPHEASGVPKSSYFGIIDTAGFPKDDFYLYQSQWLKVGTDPMVHILPHWNWEDTILRSKVTIDGKIPVRVYSNAPVVELFVDGVSQGEKKFYRKKTDFGTWIQQQSQNSDRLYLEWPLEFEYNPGTQIKAIAKDVDGNIIATDIITTAGQPAAISLSPDRQIIKADGRDLSYITVDIIDAEGNFMPTAMNQMIFQISGEGKIVGVDNGNAASWERYKDTDGVWKRKAFNGKALVIVQSTEKSGSFTVKAIGAGLRNNEITVYTRDPESASNEILGYDISRMITDVGTVPVLPSTVTAVLGDGSKVKKAVTWDSISAADVANPGDVTVKGKSGNASVTLILTVRELVGILDSALVTQTGIAPELPEKVSVFWSDGLMEMRAVAWDAIPDGAMNKAGEIIIKGTVANTEMKATARIRTVDELSDVVISRAGNGTVVEATYEEGNGGHPVSQINDGIYEMENGWGNWHRTARENDTVTFTLPKAYEISHVRLWFSSIKSWKIPTGMTIEYWNGNDWVPVSGQSMTSAFSGRMTENENYTGQSVSFDPVMTDKLRFVFVFPPNTDNPFKDMGKITEIDIYGKDVKYGSHAALSSICLDGKPLEDFDGNTLLYTRGLRFDASIPVVTATAEDHAVFIIRQALRRDGAAHVMVISEDGHTIQNYSVQFVEEPVRLKTAAITNQTKAITEDDITPLNITGTLENGDILGNDIASIRFSVADKSGHAAVIGGSLYAYEPGIVEVTAHIGYLSEVVDSAPVAFTIKPNAAPKKVVSYEGIIVYTGKGIVPILPSKVKAEFDKGLSKGVSVSWENVDQSLYDTYGSVVASGTVEGQKLRPKATVVVRNAAVAQQVSTATPRGMVPELPNNVFVYFTDGNMESNIPIAWSPMKESDFDVAEESIVAVKGTVQIEGHTLKTTANIRVGEAARSRNYIIIRNGYVLPVALASYTNDDYSKRNSSDDVSYINDGVTDFNNGTGKKIWSNWVCDESIGNPDRMRSEDWVTATIAYEGIPVERYVNQVNAGFFREKSPGSIDTPKAYYVEYYTGPIDYKIEQRNNHVLEWENSPLNAAGNWKEVTYINKPNPDELSSTSMTSITFKPVKTHLLRLRMEARDGKALGLTEMEVYGNENPSHDNYKVNAITLDGVNVADKFDENLTLTYKRSANNYPPIRVNATNNAAVTINPPVGSRDTAVITIFPEDGNDTAKKTYTIHFTK